MSSTKKEGISMIQIDWKFRHQRHREVIGGLQNFYAELDSIKDTKRVITELQTQIGNLCAYCRECCLKNFEKLLTSKLGYMKVV